MSEERYVIINALLYVALFLYYWKRHRGLNTGTLVIGLWTLCAVVGVFYEPVNFLGHMRKITLWPYIYLFVCVTLMLIPICTFKAEKLQKIGVNNRMLILLGIIIGLIAIPPFMESLIYYLQNRGNTQLMLDAFNERYQDASTTYSYLSVFSRRLSYILHSIRTLTLFMLVYMPTFHNKGKLFKLSYSGVCLATSMMILEPLILLARFQIAIYFIYGFFIFLIVRNLYSDKLRVKSRKILIIFICVIGSILILQTASRYLNWTQNLGQQEVGTVVYLGQYMGESMGNFNGNIVHSDYYTGIDNILRTYADFFGISYDNTHYAENRFHTNLFFTVVGEYWRAYGGVATFFIFLIFPFLFYLAVKRVRYSNVPFVFMIFFFMYAKIALVGIFYNAYAVDKDELLVMPLFMLLLTNWQRRIY